MRTRRPGEPSPILDYLDILPKLDPDLIRAEQYTFEVIIGTAGATDEEAEDQRVPAGMCFVADSFYGYIQDQDVEDSEFAKVYMNIFSEFERRNLFATDINMQIFFNLGLSIPLSVPHVYGEGDTLSGVVNVDTPYTTTAAKRYGVMLIGNLIPLKGSKVLFSEEKSKR